MKTSNLVTILRCREEDIEKCKNCSSFDDCKCLAGQDLLKIAADRIEQLLIITGALREQLIISNKKSEEKDSRGINLKKYINKK